MPKMPKTITELSKYCRNNFGWGVLGAYYTKEYRIHENYTFSCFYTEPARMYAYYRGHQIKFQIEGIVDVNGSALGRQICPPMVSEPRKPWNLYKYFKGDDEMEEIFEKSPGFFEDCNYIAIYIDGKKTHFKLTSFLELVDFGESINAIIDKMPEGNY